MKLGAPRPPPPLSNAAIRAACKMKAGQVGGAPNTATMRPISTGGSSSGSSGALAVTDCFKLMDTDITVVFESLYVVKIGENDHRTSLVGLTTGQVYPEFTAVEQRELRELTCKIWSINNSSCAVRLMGGFNSTRTPDSATPHTGTADFSALYTNLSKADINIAVRFWVEKLFAQRPGGNWGIYLVLDKTTLRYTATWRLLGAAPAPMQPPQTPQLKNPRNSKGALHLTADEFLALLEFYLEHTYMWFNGKLIHQIDGIPMGTEFSVFLAQWVLSYYEYRFINELIFNKAWALLRMYQFVCRYIDDVFALDCPLLHDLAYQSQRIRLGNGRWLYGIYPTSLTLNKEHSIKDPQTGKPTNSIPMLDMDISYVPETSTLTCASYDKRKTMKLASTPITKYALHTSMMSTHMSINILYSACHRPFEVCFRWQDFAYDAATHLYELYAAGHDFAKLHDKLCRFFRTHPPSLYRSAHNNTVHARIYHLFSRFTSSGHPLVDHRNQKFGFLTRRTTLSPIVWPRYPDIPQH